MQLIKGYISPAKKYYSSYLVTEILFLCEIGLISLKALQTKRGSPEKFLLM